MTNKTDCSSAVFELPALILQGGFCFNITEELTNMKIKKENRIKIFQELGNAFRYARNDLQITKEQAAKLLNFSDVRKYELMEAGDYRYMNRWTVNDFISHLFLMGKELHFSIRDTQISKENLLYAFTPEELQKALKERTENQEK